MAIVVEEERGERGGLVTGLIWLVILGVIGAAVYYVFFKRPNLIEIKAPTNFRDTQALSTVNLNTETIVNSEEFRNLKEHVSVRPQVPTGRPNPFLGF